MKKLLAFNSLWLAGTLALHVALALHTALAAVAQEPEIKLSLNQFAYAIGEAGDFSNLPQEVVENDLFKAFQALPNGAVRAGGEQYDGGFKFWKIVEVPGEPGKRAWYVRQHEEGKRSAFEIVWLLPPFFNYTLEFDYKGDPGELFVHVPHWPAAKKDTLTTTSEWQHYRQTFEFRHAKHVSVYRYFEGDVYVTNMRLTPDACTAENFDDFKFKPEAAAPFVAPEPPLPRGPNLLNAINVPQVYGEGGRMYGKVEAIDETNNTIKLHGLTLFQKHGGFMLHDGRAHEKLRPGKYRFSFRGKGGAPATETRIVLHCVPAGDPKEHSFAMKDTPEWKVFEQEFEVAEESQVFIRVQTKFYPGQEEFFEGFHLESNP